MITTSFAATIDPDEEVRRQSRRAVIASTIGTVIEWYDFGIYNIAAALVFPALFFPKSDPYVGALNAFLVFAVGYIARPVGALVFGHFGDRLGRKGALVATMLIMGFGTFIVAFVPTYAEIGLWGAVILAVLRFFQGMGVGGEWGGAILVAMEWGGKSRRGLYASLPQIGVPMGTLIANLVFQGASYSTGAAFMSWGWRIPFALSAILVVIGIYIRLGIAETPVFRRVVEERRVERLPVLEALKRTYKQIISVAFLRISELSVFLIFTIQIFTIGTETFHLTRDFILMALLVALAIECATVPLSGWLADRFGRKRIFMIGAIACGLYAFPYYAGLGSGAPFLIFIVIAISLIPHGLQYGSEAALITESFTARLRYSGSSIGYQLASLLGGGPTPAIAGALLIRDHSGYLIAGYLLICSIISVIAATTMKEGRHRDVAVEYDRPA